MSTVRMLSPFLLLLLLVPCHSLRATGVAKQLPAQLAVHKKMFNPGAAFEGPKAADLAEAKAVDYWTKAKEAVNKLKNPAKLVRKLEKGVDKFKDGKDTYDKLRGMSSPPLPPPLLLTPAPAAVVDGAKATDQAEAEDAVDNYIGAVDKFQDEVDKLKNAKEGAGPADQPSAAIPVKISSFHVSSFLASLIFLGLFSF